MCTCMHFAYIHYINMSAKHTCKKGIPLLWKWRSCTCCNTLPSLPRPTVIAALRVLSQVQLCGWWDCTVWVFGV